jgi:hypothetical protein
MLKVSRIDNGNSPTLKLEGKLIGPWVGELARLLIEFPNSSLLRLDLAAINFVDFAGAELLKDLINRGASVVTCSSFVAELLAMETR